MSLPVIISSCIVPCVRWRLITEEGICRYAFHQEPRENADSMSSANYGLSGEVMGWRITSFGKWRVGLRVPSYFSGRWKFMKTT